MSVSASVEEMVDGARDRHRTGTFRSELGILSLPCDQPTGLLAQAKLGHLQEMPQKILVEQTGKQSGGAVC
jgi:hypothetical protein